MRLAEALGGSEFEVPILVLDAGALVRDDLDAGLAGLFEHRLKRLFVIRNDADLVDLFGDEVFDRTHLQRGIRAGRSDHRGVDAILGALFLDAGGHGVEPRNAADFDDYADRGFGRGKCAGGDHGGERDAREQGASREIDQCFLR